MKKLAPSVHPGFQGFLVFAILLSSLAWGVPQDSESNLPTEAIQELNKALAEAKESSSSARQRLAVRRAIRDAETLLESQGDSPGKFPVLEFLFRAQQQLIALDDDSKHRDALIETSRKLIEAPDQFADLRLEADLLLSQADLARKGAGAEARAEALRPFVDRYLDTPVAAKVLRLAMVMALELGDNRLVTDLREMIKERFAGDLEMISFQRDKLGGQVFGAPFTGHFERSDGKLLRFPMDGLGYSTMFLFWSKENGGDEVIKGIAAAALEQKEELAGRLEFISVNLDELPDAGESFLRELGVDWQALRFPGGKENPVYDAYVRVDPRILTMNPTGNTAIIMSGSTRKRVDSDGEPDYARMFGSALARSWTQPRYIAHLSSLMSGEFLVLDPEGEFDPTLPPEWKALKSPDAVTPLPRTAESVPEGTLQAIQDSFVAPPLRYRLSPSEIRSNQEKTVNLCRKAIADHPNAPDLWIVRNRLIVALLGLWKSDADLAWFEKAATEAKAAMEAGYPSGCEVVARFCLTRERLRDPSSDSRELLQEFTGDSNSENSPGPVLGAASILALDVADRLSFEKYREIILKDHTDHPMMWTFSSFLLDRYHDYWLFQVPFVAGWSYGRREDYFLTKGDSEEANRDLKAELRTLEGTSFRIPEDLQNDWNVFVFAKPGPWSKKREDELPPSPQRLFDSLIKFTDERPNKDVKPYLVMLGEDAEAIRSGFEDKEIPESILILPNGIMNPLIQQIGVLSEDNQLNSVMVNKDGRIAVSLSGLSKQSGKSGTTLINVIHQKDEELVVSLIESGDLERAKEWIFSLAPPYDPEAVDEKGRKLKQPQYSLSLLRARARVYLALKDWEKALADAEEVVQKQMGKDGGMSMRTDELDEAEELRDLILSKREESVGKDGN